MEGQRLWEDLDDDCLVNVVGRVGMESLLLDVPFVCKSWYRASLNPSCWKHLVFPKFQSSLWEDDTFVDRFMNKYRIQKFSVDAFVKLIVARSHGNCSSLINLPDGCTEHILKYIADECPALRTLSVPNVYKQSLIIPELIGKWKILEDLGLGSSHNLIEIISKISLDCRNFSGLRVSVASIRKEEASAIVTNLPKIKYLFLREAHIDLENLATILQGCKELVHLDVSNCIGFETDNKLLELASHIRTFNSAGSRLYRIYDYDDYDHYWAIRTFNSADSGVYDYDDNDDYDHYDDYDDYWAIRTFNSADSGLYGYDDYWVIGSPDVLDDVEYLHDFKYLYD